MADVLAEIDDLVPEANAELSAVQNPAQLESFRIKWLGAKGTLKSKMDLIKQVPPDQKRLFGQRLNAAKDQITAAFDSRKQSVETAGASVRLDLDITEPGRRPQIGNRHILMKVIDELTELFARMGFSQASGPEVEDEFHNFIALNIPRQHPARDPLDNFYLAPATGEGEVSAYNSVPEDQQRLLRTQTSTVQIRVMETQKPPIRVVIPGRVYRPDTVDQTHFYMFHQLEALVVDKNVSMVDLKSTVMQFVHAYFGPDTKVRFRPSFFPFTEPSAEVDVFFEDRQKWVELGGCGMVHPNVLKVLDKQGLNSEEYSGWAFGFGIERIAMRKYGIEDIRQLFENDVRFLRQF